MLIKNNIININIKRKLYERKSLHFTFILHSFTHVLKSIDKSYNKMFLTRFNLSYTHRVKIIIIKLFIIKFFQRKFNINFLFDF